MYLYYCDETNLDQENEFFIYGGVVIDTDAAPDLAKQLSALRDAAGVKPAWLLKFNPCPENLTHDQFRELKKGYVNAAAERGVVFALDVVLHRIAASQDDPRRFAVNNVLYNFNLLLAS